MSDYFVTDRLRSGARQVDAAPMQSPPSANLQSLGTVTPEDRAALLMRPPLIDGGRTSANPLVSDDMEAMMRMPGSQDRNDPGASVRPPPGREEEPPATVRGEYARELRGKGRRPELGVGYRKSVGF
jgi:hypothetical protein